MNLRCTSNPSLIEVISAPAVAQSGIKMRRPDSSCKGLAVNCCSPVSTNKYRSMLRVVSESSDTCSHRKGGFICKHVYLFVHKQQARTGTALQGKALLLPHQDQAPEQQMQACGVQSHPAASGLETFPEQGHC